jgi:hypothetical protein
LPDIGKNIADTAHRDGVAERCDDPAVPKTLAVARELSTDDAQLRSDLALFLRTTAKPHDAQTLDLFQTGPGLGTILRLVLLDDMHQSERVPRGQDFASSGRLVKGAQASGGQRVGTSGNKMGNAHLTWAFAAAATLCLRGNESGQKSLARVEKTPDTGKALRLLAHQLARAVSGMRKRQTAFDLEQFLRTSGRSAGAPGAELAIAGRRLHRTAVTPMLAASVNAEVRRGPISLRPARCLDTRSGSCRGGG